MLYTGTHSHSEIGRYLTESGRQEWNELILGISEDGRPPTPGTPRDLLLRMIAARFESSSVVKAPVECKPPWMTERAGTLLLEEARQSRTRAVRGLGNWKVQGGRIAQAICLSPTLHEWVQRELALDLQPKAHSAYLFNDSEGDGSEIHLDKAEGFEVNILVKLEHILSDTGARSTTFTYSGKGAAFHDLEVGEALIFCGPATLHGRTEVRPGERITLLSIGFCQSPPE